MDYTVQGLSFKLRKSVRYLTLYGPRRTMAKIRAQYHMKRRYAALPTPIRAVGRQAHVGIIGCGNYAFSTLAYYLRRNYGRVIRGVMDTEIARAASLCEHYGAGYYTDRADDVLSDPSIDLVFIASNHASHAEYAMAALEAGKCVHIEKPHVVNEGQLVRLCNAMVSSKGRVNLGFNRPLSRMGRAIGEAIAREHGPMMLNWFVAGHEIAPDHWYFQEAEGGRVLGNLCHWTDFLLRLVPRECRYPIRITPTRGAKSDCDIAVTYAFGDESIAAITFSAKGHTFEGVRERFAAHRGNVLIALDDFRQMTIEVVDKKQRWRGLFRDHGHEASVARSCALVRAGVQGCSPEYVWDTGYLFLQTRRALDLNEAIMIDGNEQFGHAWRTAEPAHA